MISSRRDVLSHQRLPIMQHASWVHQPAWRAKRREPDFCKVVLLESFLLICQAVMRFRREPFRLAGEDMSQKRHSPIRKNLAINELPLRLVWIVPSVCFLQHCLPIVQLFAQFMCYGYTVRAIVHSPLDQTLRWRSFASHFLRYKFPGYLAVKRHGI
jgi:hypothetical protein